MNYSLNIHTILYLRFAILVTYMIFYRQNILSNNDFEYRKILKSMKIY